MSSVAQEFKARHPLAKLKPHPKNPNRGDMDALRESIDKNGFYGAIIAQRSSGTIIAGEHRYRALLESGAKTAPVILVDVDDETALRMLAADNEVARKGTYDDDALASLLEELRDTTGGLEGTGFDQTDLDRVLGLLERPESSLLDPDSMAEEVPTCKCPKCGHVFPK